MRIFINAASAHMGGSVVHLRNILRHLPQILPRSRVLVVVPEATRSALATDANIDVRAYPYADTNGLNRLYFDQIDVPRLIEENDTDVLFSATGFGTLRTRVPQVLLVRNMAYFDLTFQAKYRELNRSFLRTRLRRWHSLLSIRVADSVLFPTRAMREAVDTHLSLEGTDTYALHYGFDEEVFGTNGNPQADTDAAVRSQIGAGGRPVLLNVSTYAVHKNLETLIDALPKLCRAYPDLCLVTTTSREQTSDVDEYDSLKRRAVELGVDDHWVELGYVPHEDLPALYRTADVYVFPSFTESFGHSMVEAMASGLPVVSSDTEVHREVCGDAAAYFDTFDATDCAETIRDVLADDDQRIAMERAAACRTHHFSWERYVERLAEIFSQTARRA